MANYKSFVFNSTNDSQRWVTPSHGKYHLYLDQSGQINVINHLGEIVLQSFSGGSSSGSLTAVLAGTNIDVTGPATSRTVALTANPSIGGNLEVGGTATFYGGASFQLSGPVEFQDGIVLTSNADLTTATFSAYFTFTPSNSLPPASEGRVFYSAGTGMYVCTGSTAADWKRL